MHVANKTPMVCGLAADNKNLYSIIILWNNHYNLNFNVGQQEMKMTIMHRS